MNTFQGGAIYWSPSTGAHVVYGGIGAKYNSMGGPTSWLGLPTSDEQSLPDGQLIPNIRVSYFANGKIVWTADGGAKAMQNPSEMTFDSGYMTFDNGVPVGGWAKVTLSSDGSYHFWGSFHDSGLLDYTDTVSFGILGLDGNLYQVPLHSGSVKGHITTFFGGSNDDNWDTSGNDPALRAEWPLLSGCSGYFKADTKWDASALVGEVAQAGGLVLSIVPLLSGGHKDPQPQQ
jgi:hypothetical protein